MLGEFLYGNCHLNYITYSSTHIWGILESKTRKQCVDRKRSAWSEAADPSSASWGGCCDHAPNSSKPPPM